ncbi:MAG: site-specific integrase, partial [Vagococcus fluvialis]
LILFNIKQTKEQYVFSYTDRKGNINTTLHTDYLNYRMDSIKRRHPNLAFAKPHMLRHTGATLAKKFGISLKQISEGLTHSDTSVTKAYINTPDVVNIPIGEIVYQKVKEVSKKEDKK